MKISNKISFFLFLLFVLPFTSCDDDEGGMDDPQELITTVQVRFSTPDGTQVSTFTISDPDGAGGNEPLKETIIISSNTQYIVNTSFLDESDPNSVEDITTEVNEESIDHLVCFNASGAMIAPSSMNSDPNGDPIGTSAGVTTTTAGTGTLTISLKHMPDKSAAAPCSTGDTDVEVTFNVEVQ